MKQNLVIGSGAFGIFTTLELLSQNSKVLLITDNKLQDSISYNYTVHLSKTTLDLDFDLVNCVKYIKANNIYDWFYMIRGYILNNYENKEYIYNKCLTKLKKYNINVNEKDKITLLYGNKTIDYIINVIFPKYIKSDQLKIIENTYVNLNNIKNTQNIDNYENIYVCVGSKKKHKYTKPIYGFKMIIDSELKPNQLSKDDELLVSKISINNKEFLNVEGGIIIDNNRQKYHNQYSNNYFNLKNKIKDSIIWTKYKCKNIENLFIGKRSVSIDGYPFYYKKNNIHYLEGGSFSGFMYAPLFVHCVVNNIKDPYIDFTINRIKTKIYYVNLIIFIFIITFIALIIN